MHAKRDAQSKLVVITLSQGLPHNLRSTSIVTLVSMDTHRANSLVLANTRTKYPFESGTSTWSKKQGLRNKLSWLSTSSRKQALQDTQYKLGSAVTWKAGAAEQRPHRFDMLQLAVCRQSQFPNDRATWNDEVNGYVTCSTHIFY